MIVRSFNQPGIQAFESFLREYENARVTTADLNRILTNSNYHATFDRRLDFDYERTASKLSLAKSVCDAFVAARYRDLPLEPTGENLGMWSWLAATVFDVVRGRPQLGARHYYVLSPDTPQLRFRLLTHRLAGPSMIYWLFRDRPEDARLPLSGVAYQRGSDMNEFATRKEFMQNRSVMAVANRLYYNALGARPKAGRHGDPETSPGTIQRFISVVRQLDLTYDLYAMTPEQILDLLPSEFDRWKD